MLLISLVVHMTPRQTVKRRKRRKINHDDYTQFKLLGLLKPVPGEEDDASVQ